MLALRLGQALRRKLERWLTDATEAGLDEESINALFASSFRELPTLNLVWIMDDHTNGTSSGGISPYAERGAVVHTYYSQHMMRTIEQHGSAKPWRSWRPLRHEHKLPAGPVRGVANIHRAKPVRDQALLNLLLASEAQCGVRRQYEPTRGESVRVPERYEREGDVRDLTVLLDPAHSRDIPDSQPGVDGPLLPRPAIWAPGLENEMTPVAQRASDSSQRRAPLGVGEEDLGHVPRHHRNVGTQGWQRGGVTMDPGD
jgi:hypothetical protein